MTITGYSDRINHAFAFAAKHHDRQVRKGTRLPYLTHPANVAVILTRYGRDEHTVVAGILHDVIEDCVREAYTRRHARAAHRRQVRTRSARHRARRDASPGGRRRHRAVERRAARRLPRALGAAPASGALGLRGGQDAQRQHRSSPISIARSIPTPSGPASAADGSARCAGTGASTTG